ncbi:MAG: serpin family protein, partial [Thermomicrobiales bacterium]|nr:serpin family protein [Thermomicrobiales bacterium]
MTWFLIAVLLWLPMSMGASAQPDDTSELVAGNSAFAFDLYGALIEHADGNLIVSPYSISQALAMTFAGAGGETATQMADTLSFTLPQPSLHDAFGALNTDLVERVYAEDDPDVVQTARGLRIANALWGEQTYPFNPKYSALIEQDYGAGLQQTDFMNAPEDARDEINGWVAEQTEDHIQDIVPEDAIGPDTRLVLANAIWFSGGWYLPFDPDATEDGEFTLLDGATVTVPFMFTHSHLSYGRGEGFQAIELDYAGSEFTFTIILPDDGQFETFESTLDAAALDTAIGQLSY